MALSCWRVKNSIRVAVLLQSPLLSQTQRLSRKNYCFHSPNKERSLGKLTEPPTQLSGDSKSKSQLIWWHISLGWQFFVRVQAAVKSNNYRAASEKLKAPCQLSLPGCTKSAFGPSHVRLTLGNYSSRRGRRARLSPCMQVWEQVCRSPVLY